MPDQNQPGVPVPVVTAFTMKDLEAYLVRDEPNEQLQGLKTYRDDVLILGLTLYGEGRSENIAGRAGIAWSVKNRKLGYFSDKGHTYAQVCLRRMQYSCWQPIDGEANHRALMAMVKSVLIDKGTPLGLLTECNYIAAGVIQNQILDLTKGATHYCTEALFQRTPPTWALQSKVSARIGNHVFFSGVK